MTKSLKHKIGVLFGIRDWIDYDPIAFATLDELKTWFIEKTKERIVELAPEHISIPVDIRFRVYKTKVRQVVWSGGYAIYSERVTANCERTTHGTTGELMRAVITYDPEKAAQTCKDCLDNLITHEVLHIQYPCHGKPFQTAYTRVLREKYAKDGGIIPLNYDCRSCQEKAAWDKLSLVTDDWYHKLKSKYTT